MPPSSLYWIQKSASSNSSAAGKRRSAASPDERPPYARAVRGTLLNSPTPMVPAPRAIVLLRKERRLTYLFRGLAPFSLSSSNRGFSVGSEPFTPNLVNVFMPVHRPHLHSVLHVNRNDIVT